MVAIVSEKINRILKNHEKRIDALESVLSKTKTPKIKKAKKTLTDHILALRDDAFFSQPKTAEDVHKKLQTSYPCVLNRVEVALIRISSRKNLRKASKTISGKNYSAYVW